MHDWKIETRHAEGVVLLGCDACEACLSVSTESPGFLDSLSAFLEGHSRCRITPSQRPATA